MEGVLKLEFGPELVARVVDRAMERRSAGDALREEYRTRLEGLYALDRKVRAQALGRLQRDIFERLGWPSFFGELLEDFRGRVPLARIGASEQEEGCFIGGRGELVVRLSPRRFENRLVLRLYLDHELLHAKDLLDPAFGYRPEPMDPATRARYVRLWCDSVEARLRGERSGPVTHAELLARARAGTTRCSLCRLPAALLHRVEGPWAERLREAEPAWDPLQGVCERCLEWARLSRPSAG